MRRVLSPLMPGLLWGALPDPGALPLRSLESRAAARRLLEARRPLETTVYTDPDGWPIFEPGVRYAPFLLAIPLENKTPETPQQWLARVNGPNDPVERKGWVRENEEKLKIQRAVWAEQHGLPERGLRTLSPDQERVQREKERACREAFERSKRGR